MMMCRKRFIISLTAIGIQYAVAASIDAEFELPAYLNKEKANLVFVAENLKEPVKLTVDFREKDNGTVPRDPVTLMLRKAGRSVVGLDISGWPDGEYIASIQSGQDLSLTRVLRKQTISSPKAPSDPIHVSGLNMLFFDDCYLDHQDGLERQVNPPNVYPVTSRMMHDHHPIVSIENTKLAVDADGVFEVEITDQSRKGNQYANTAVSTNLTDWVFEERKIVPAETKQFQAAKDPWRWFDPEGKKVSYRLYNKAADGPVDLGRVHVQYTGWSPNGRQWGDVHMQARSTYPVWRKTDREFIILRTDPITTDHWRVTSGDVGDWKDSNDNWGGQWMDSQGRYHFCQARVIPRADPFVVWYDNILGNRILVNWVTSNGFDWTPHYLIVPDESDPVGSQHYGADVFPAENGQLQVGYLRVYDQLRQQVCIDLIYSRDSMVWKRFPHQPKFISNASKWGWNFGYTGMIDHCPIEKDGKIYQLFLGLNAPHLYMSVIHGGDDQMAFFNEEYVTRRWHHGRVFKKPNGIEEKFPYWHLFGSRQAVIDYGQYAAKTVGLVEMRKDGWVALAPKGYAGSFVTKVFTGSQRLSLNAKTGPYGQIRVEVLDVDGGEIGSYCGDNAAAFSGDSVDASVAWASGTMDVLPADGFRLRVSVVNSRLFAMNWR